jgi:hypothetical protein
MKKCSFTGSPRMLKYLVNILLIALAILPASAQQTDLQGYSPKVNSYGNYYNQLRADIQHIPHRYALSQGNTTDSTPQLFVWSTSSGDSLVLLVNNRYVIVGAGAFVNNNGNVNGMKAVTITSTPLPGNLGQVYAVTDGGYWLYDNGTSFDTLGTRGGGGGGGGGSGFSMHALSSSNFTSSTSCPIPALNNDSLQIFWNDVGRFLQEGTEWQNYSGGGFSILIPGFNASTSSYSLTLYANNVAYPPGPQNFTSSNFTSSVNCPIPAYNGMTLMIYWNDAQRYLVQGTDWTPLAGGGFTITISGFNATTSNYSFYVFAQ